MSERPGISLDEWWPLVCDLPGVNVPRTLVYHANVDLMPLAYAADSMEEPEVRAAADAFEVAVDAIRAAAERIGTYPVFLRTGLGSGKHEWTRTCFVPDAASVPSHVSALINWSATVDFLGLPADVWVVREMLPTVPAFLAFEGMPITKERRFFVRDNELLGWQPYWPPAAIADSWGAPKGWRPKLAALNKPEPGETDMLTDLSLRVSRAVPGAWSVDWLWTRLGWYLTDMAWAEQSFVWDDYPTAPKGLRS